MGSAQIKELYRGSKPHDDAFPLSINADSLQLGDEYVAAFLRTVQKSLNLKDDECTTAETRDTIFP